MEIFLKRFPEEDFREISVEGSITVEGVYRKFEGDFKYPVVGALRNNTMVHLGAQVKANDRIELLDMRNSSVLFVYQRSVVFLFLKAAHDVLGKDVKVKLCHPVNNGIYARTIEDCEECLSKSEEIKKRMQELIDEDLPFERLHFSTNKVMKFLDSMKMEEKKNMTKKNGKSASASMCELDGYIDFWYDYLLPSTGYIYAFDLVRYYDGFLIRYPRADHPEGLPKNKDDLKLLTAFQDADQWETLMGVEYVDDLNKMIKNGKMPELIQVSEAIHEKKIVEIAKEIVEKKKRIILIAGPSSSGKTSFANRLKIQLMVNGLKPIAFSTDDYFINREDLIPDENGRLNFEGLDALEIEMFNRDMNALLAGEQVDIPTFNFITGKKEFGSNITQLNQEQPIIIEGIHGLNDKLTADIPDEEKFKIYISPLTSLNIDNHNIVSTTDERMLRRMVRDYKTRGKSADETIRTWPSVRAGEEENIFPYINEADVFFNSVFIYEMSVLKKYVQPILEEVTVDMEEYPEAERLLRLLKFFDTCKDEKTILNNSIIREFIGGSIFFE